MSTIIREAIIRLRIEQQRAKLEAPKTEEATRSYKEAEKAQRETAKATRETAQASKESGETIKTSAENATRATRNLEQATADSSYKMIGHFREGGEGALRFARGIAFLSANGSDDLKRLVQTVMVAQGAFDVFAGGAKALTHLAAAFGPVGAAATVATVAILAGIKALEGHADAAERDAKAHQKLAREIKNFYQEQERGRSSLAAAEQSRGAEAAGLGVSSALTPQERLAALERAKQRNATEWEQVKKRHKELIGQITASAHSASVQALPGEDFWSPVYLRSRAHLDPRMFEEFRGSYERRESNAREDLSITKQKFDMQKEASDTQRQIMNQMLSSGIQGASSIGVPGLRGFALFGASQVRDASNSTFDARMQDLTNRTQKAMDTLVRIIEESADKAARLERALDPAHTN